MNSNIKLKAIDFFCSAGGVTCGFRQSGIKVLGGIDIDKSCKETYERNNKAKFLHADVSYLSKKKIGEFFGIKRNQEDLIFVGCSPCQYYSNINTNKTKSTITRLLLEDFQEFVDFYRPGYIFIENVPGFDKNHESPLVEFKNFLKINDYVFDDDILNVKHYGVPQNRRRYVLLATRVRKKINLPIAQYNKTKTVADAIGDLKKFPPIKAGHKDSTDFKHSSASLCQLNLKRISITPQDGGDRRSWPDDLQLPGYKINKGYYDVYGRMFWDKPSPTITTRFNSYSNGRYGHPIQNRAISIREGATLQTFPFEYKFYSNSQIVITRMIGNAVPPVFAKKIGEAIMKAH